MKSLNIFSIIIWIISGFVSISSASIFNIQKAQGVEECNNTNSNSYKCAMAIENQEIPKVHEMVSRENDTLTISLINQKVAFTSKFGGDYETTLAYAYLGFEPQFKLHIIYLQYYEGEGYLAIHQKSGLRYELIGYPIPSPTFDFFAAISEDMSASFSPNGFEIWQASGQTFFQMTRLESDWGPRSATWVSPHQISIKKMCWDQNQPPEYIPCGTVIIELKDGVWGVSE
jgi:hypothetical protein